MFSSSTIIRELALNLAKVIFMLNRSVELRPYLLCDCVAACYGMACVFYAVQNATESVSKGKEVAVLIIAHDIREGKK